VLARVRDIIEQNLAFDAELGGLLGMSELFLTGGRRSGKTFLMEAILCSYAVAVPDSIVWTVVPSEKFIEEPRKVIADSILPSAWYEYNGSPQFTFYLVNGSQHVLLSGHKPSNLKKGRRRWSASTRRSRSGARATATRAARPWTPAGSRSSQRTRRSPATSARGCSMRPPRSCGSCSTRVRGAEPGGARVVVDEWKPRPEEPA
jgi:hypothetical protein